MDGGGEDGQWGSGESGLRGRGLCFFKCFWKSSMSEKNYPIIVLRNISTDGTRTDPILYVLYIYNIIKKVLNNNMRSKTLCAHLCK